MDLQDSHSDYSADPRVMRFHLTGTGKRDIGIVYIQYVVADRIYAYVLDIFLLFKLLLVKLVKYKLN